MHTNAKCNRNYGYFYDLIFKEVFELDGNVGSKHFFTLKFGRSPLPNLIHCAPLPKNVRTLIHIVCFPNHADSSGDAVDPIRLTQ